MSYRQNARPLTAWEQTRPLIEEMRRKAKTMRSNERLDARAYVETMANVLELAMRNVDAIAMLQERVSALETQLLALRSDENGVTAGGGSGSG